MLLLAGSLARLREDEPVQGSRGAARSTNPVGRCSMLFTPQGRCSMLFTPAGASLDPCGLYDEAGLKIMPPKIYIVII